MSENNLLPLLPKVDDWLRDPQIAQLAQRSSQMVLRHCVQQAIESLRESARQGKLSEERLRQLHAGAKAFELVWEELSRFEFQRCARAVNATGVVLHTGLGRAPLAAPAVAAAQAASGYCMLEIDRKSGERGQRDRGIESLLQLIFGCQAAAVVNNNAAATLLAVHTFSKGKESIVSRGELVEIGGSYRMPEVMKIGGAKLVEVGTTNRTRIDDYRQAITPKTGLLLKVHSSNFRIEGFTESASLAELVALGKEKKIPVVHDLGSGLSIERKWDGLAQEPRVKASLSAGVDLVTFSGDKLLGGPQSGILLGSHEAIAKIRKNALFRAMRLNKQVLAALESTLQIYLRGEDAVCQEIPTLRMLSLSVDEIGKRAERLAHGIRSLNLKGLNVSIEDSQSQVGSGSAPGVHLPTKVVALVHEKIKSAKFAQKLRLANPPVFTRVQEERVLLDPRTLLEGDESYLIAAISSVPDTCQVPK